MSVLVLKFGERKSSFVFERFTESFIWANRCHTWQIYSETCQASKMEFFTKIVNGFLSTPLYIYSNFDHPSNLYLWPIHLQTIMKYFGYKKSWAQCFSGLSQKCFKGCWEEMFVIARKTKGSGFLKFSGVVEM